MSISRDPSIVKCTGILPSAVRLSCSWIIVDILAPKTKIYILTATQMILMIPFTFAIMEMIEKNYSYEKGKYADNLR